MRGEELVEIELTHMLFSPFYVVIEMRYAHQENLYSIFVHVAVDAIANVGVILSIWLMAMYVSLSLINTMIFILNIRNTSVILSTFLRNYMYIYRGWLLADPIVAIGIIGLMVTNAIPICQRTGKVLLQTTPLTIKDQLDKCLREVRTIYTRIIPMIYPLYIHKQQIDLLIHLFLSSSILLSTNKASTLDGVLECRNEHFWTQSPGVFVGSLNVRIRSDANEQLVLARVQQLFGGLITHLTVQIEKDEWTIPTSVTN